MGHVRDMYPQAVAVARALDGDGVVEILGVRAVYGDGRKVAQILAALASLPAGRLDGLLLDLRRERARGLDGGEERVVDVARVVRGAKHLDDLAAQRAALLADAHQHDVAGLGPPPQLAGNEDRATLLYEEGIGDRILAPTDQLGRQNHGTKKGRSLKNSMP